MGKKFVIIAGYFADETYGLLGPQLAATIIRNNTPYECIVAAVTREDDKVALEKALLDYFDSAPPVIGFSLLGGRDDLIAFAAQMKTKGAITILAGPQAGVDYLGEAGRQDHPHRFKGFFNAFSFALQGPAEQIFPYLNDAQSNGPGTDAGIVYREDGGGFVHNPPEPWHANFLSRVEWKNIHRLKGESLVPMVVSSAQVLQQIGCPHAAKSCWLKVDYPAFIDPDGKKTVGLKVKGCSFCDVAMDKGFFGTLETEPVIEQVEGLPDGGDGRKIPFELINENPLPGLNSVLDEIKRQKIAVSRVNLTMRADWLVRGESRLVEILKTARTMDIRIVLTAVGFESFDDSILRNLNKGVEVATNLAAVRLIRRLKKNFPEHWGYLRSEGGNHGFIHPTPWDTKATAARSARIIARHGLSVDILPNHSTPLIIHHASRLGDWIRFIEEKEGVQFERNGSIIAWWQIGDRFVL